MFRVSDQIESSAAGEKVTSTSAPARTRLTGNIEQLALGAGLVTGAFRALLADLVNAIKNASRVFIEAHRNSYRKNHIVRRKL